MNKITKSYGFPDVQCPWCDRDLKLWETNYKQEDPVIWQCCCGKENINSNVCFGITTTLPDFEILQFSIIKDLTNGFLEINWYSDCSNKESYWEILSGNNTLYEFNRVKYEKGNISIEEAKKIILRYSKLMAFI